MKNQMALIFLFVFSFLSLMGPITSAKNRTLIATDKDKEQAYEFGKVFLGQFIENLDEKSLAISISADLTLPGNIGPGKECQKEPPLIKDLLLQALIPFKSNSSGINVSFFGPKEKSDELDKKIDTRVMFNPSGLVGFVEIWNGTLPNTFHGYIKFLKKNSRNQEESKLKLTISSAALSFKELLISGAEFTINLPVSTISTSANSKSGCKNHAEESLKNKLMSAFLNCKAESLYANWDGTLEYQPLDACQLNFQDGQIEAFYADKPLLNTFRSRKDRPREKITDQH